LVADESVDARLIQRLRDAGLDVLAVRETHSGLADRDVLVLARTRRRVLLTEDSDFGEWVFAHREPTSGVVFLRYGHADREAMSRSAARLIQLQGHALYGAFTTITPKKTRIRRINP
jgi:predicted nuclease of predicted toxin-antitoxin system